MKAIDLTGQKFGRLLVLSATVKGHIRCRCDCGKETTPLAYNVKNGNTTSCGCALQEARVEHGKQTAPALGHANRTHGMSTSRTYLCWQEMKKRCLLPTHTRYPEYGARGVTVCDRWRDSFEDFLADMGECQPELTLERKENSKGYEPGNCEWATRETQAQNRDWNKADPAIVRAMRARAGEGAVALALEFGMSESNARLILDRKTWRNIT